MKPRQPRAMSRVVQCERRRAPTACTRSWAQCFVSRAVLTCNGGLPLIEP